MPLLPKVDAMTLPEQPKNGQPRLVLHLGAHRTGSTSLQACLHQNRPVLSAAAIGYWGPAALRRGRFPGLYKSFNPGEDPAAQAAETREIIATNREIFRRRLKNQRGMGHRHLMVSDENLLGDMQLNLARGCLYQNADDRLALLAGVFGTGFAKIALSIRRQEAYWPSLIAYRIAHGAAAPGPEKLAALAGQNHGWREVISAVRRQFPVSQILVFEFDGWAARPDLLVGELMRGAVALPALAHNPRANAALDRAALYALACARGDAESARLIGNSSGVFQPFSRAQRHSLAEQYIADQAWLGQESCHGISYFPQHFG